MSTFNRAKKYEDEFKLMIVALLQLGQSVKQVSEEYALNSSMIRKWLKSHEGNPGNFSTTSVLLEDQKRIRFLEKELRNVQLERDILKKAVSIFSVSDK